MLECVGSPLDKKSEFQDENHFRNSTKLGGKGAKTNAFGRCKTAGAQEGYPMRGVQSASLPPLLVFTGKREGRKRGVLPPLCGSAPGTIPGRASADSGFGRSENVDSLSPAFPYPSMYSGVVWFIHLETLRDAPSSVFSEVPGDSIYRCRILYCFFFSQFYDLLFL